MKLMSLMVDHQVIQQFQPVLCNRAGRGSQERIAGAKE